jgi:hypothetical protein
MAIDLLNGLLYVAMLGVVIVLGFGIYNLHRGDEAGRSRSNKLMRLRIVLQFSAIVIIALIFFLKDRLGG